MIKLSDIEPDLRQARRRRAAGFQLERDSGWRVGYR
jgi:hypothetical protein